MDKRPHVLWMMADQHNANCMGVAGHPNFRTPNLNRIAARGVHFTHACCNNRICLWRDPNCQHLIAMG